MKHELLTCRPAPMAPCHPERELTGTAGGAVLWCPKCGRTYQADCLDHEFHASAASPRARAAA